MATASVVLVLICVLLKIVLKRALIWAIPP
jgi:hypothetical protein